MEKAVWLFDTLQSVKAHVNSSVIPRNALGTDTSSAHFSCHLTTPLCPIVCDPPCSYLIGMKASYVTLIEHFCTVKRGTLCKRRCNLP